jgi:hypothetical protein
MANSPYASLNIAQEVKDFRKSMTKTINLIWWHFDPHLAYEYDWLNSLLSDFTVKHIVGVEDAACLDNAVIVANLSQIFCTKNGSRKEYTNKLQQFHNYIKRYQNEGLKVGLFHLGDEFYKESISFYKDLDFIFRPYFRKEAHKKYKGCYYLPLGYSSGFCNGLVPRKISERDYSWSFAGQLKGSRYEMLEYAQRIPGGKYHETSQWNDPNGLTTKEYAALLSNTVFSPCPIGNFSVDCFRVYESLEAGAIPIIEAKGVREALTIFFNPQHIIKYGIRDQKVWLRNYRYWEKAFSSDFPCPLIYSWKDFGVLINSIDAESTSKNIQLWWKEYKLSLTQFIHATIEETFT